MIYIRQYNWLFKLPLNPFFASQAFREVFEYLIEDFKTYKPLLSAVKSEYEMLLVHQREKIRELEPLKVSRVCFCLLIIVY